VNDNQNDLLVLCGPITRQRNSQAVFETSGAQDTPAGCFTLSPSSVLGVKRLVGFEWRQLRNGYLTVVEGMLSVLGPRSAPRL
jgi:hypothetical protein